VSITGEVTDPEVSESVTFTNPSACRELLSLHLYLTGSTDSTNIDHNSVIRSRL